MKLRSGLPALFVLTAVLGNTQDLPLTGIAHVAYRVSDIARSRAFYRGMLGFEEPFEFTDNGRTTVAFLKVNDRQYIELYPDLQIADEVRFSHLCLETADITSVHSRMAAAGLNPTKIAHARAGNLLFLVKDPDGQTIEFLQYLPGSLHSKAAGKALGSRRISTGMSHAGVAVKSFQRSLSFYRDQLGLREVRRGSSEKTEWIDMRIPGAHEDSIRMVLVGDSPTREDLGFAQHIGLESEMDAARKMLLGCGVPAASFRADGARLFDPDGTRLELVVSIP